MATQIRDSKTNELLWQADDFGRYSIDKIQAISNILKGILTDVTIHMDTSLNEESLSNVYTKDQSNNRFVQVSALKQSVEGVVSELVVSGKIPGITSLDLINSRLETLNINCTGYDYSGNKKQAGYSELIDNLNTDITNTSSNVARIFKVVFHENEDGTYDLSRVVLAKASDVGDISTLSTDISDRGNVVKAINSLMSEIITIKSSISGAVTAVSDIAKVKQDIQSATNDLSQAKTQISSLTSDMTNVKAWIGGVENLSSNESNLVEAINNINTKLTGITQMMTSFDVDLNLLKQRVSTLEGGSEEPTP